MSGDYAFVVRDPLGNPFQYYSPATDAWYPPPPFDKPFQYSRGVFGTPSEDGIYTFYIYDNVDHLGESQTVNFTAALTTPVVVSPDMSPRDNAYLPNTTPTFSWYSTGATYRHRVRISEWNNNRLVYMTDWVSGIDEGQPMSHTVASGVLRGNSPYRWYVEVIDAATGTDRTRSQQLAFTTGTKYNYLAADFGATGVLVYDGETWTRIRVADAEGLVAWGGKLVGDFGATGVFVYDGSTWSRIIVRDAVNLVAWGDKLVGEFVGLTGAFVYDGSTWSRITALDAEALVAWGGKLAADFGATGVFVHDGSTWSRIIVRDAETLVAWGDRLVGEFVGLTGVFIYDGSTWTRVRVADAEGLVPF